MCSKQALYPRDVAAFVLHTYYSCISCYLNSPRSSPLVVDLAYYQVDHASYAYNRAALYMNGPDTALNPTKEGYLPPVIAGAPVRVPRNKLFVQQIPMPLTSLAQVRKRRHVLISPRLPDDVARFSCVAHFKKTS